MFVFLILQIVHHQLLKQTSSCSINIFFLLKHCKQLLQNYFFLFYVLCSVKIFDIHVMWLVFINNKQQTYWIFKCLIRDMNWKNQLVFITIHINANVVFCFNLAKIFFSHRKFNSIIIKTISKLFYRFV